MNRGYIKLWRKLQDSFLYKDSQALHLFIHLLLECNHSKREFLFNGQKQICDRGQRIIGIDSLSAETGINRNKVYRLLKMFENETLIETQKTNRFTLISVKNYELYQGNETQNETPEKLQRNSSETPVKPINNDKNDNNNKNDNNTIEQDKPAQTTKKMPTIAQELVEGFKKLYEAETKQPFKYQSKDFIIVNKLIKDFGYDEVKVKARLLYELCKKKGAWFTEKGMADFSVGKLSSNWNNLIPEIKTQGGSKNGYTVGINKDEFFKLREERYGSGQQTV